MDVHKVHCTQDVLSVFKDIGFVLLFVPALCTSELQPLDVSINGLFEVDLKQHFTSWYAKQVQPALEKHPSDVQAAVKSAQPDLRLSVVKPLHARWLINAVATVKQRRKAIVERWKKSGISAAIRASRPRMALHQCNLLKRKNSKRQQER